METQILDNNLFIAILFILACIRVYIEVIDFDLTKLPLSRRLLPAKSARFHRFGLYMSIGYIILFAPQFLI